MGRPSVDQPKGCQPLHLATRRPRNVGRGYGGGRLHGLNYWRWSWLHLVNIRGLPLCVVLARALARKTHVEFLLGPGLRLHFEIVVDGGLGAGGVLALAEERAPFERDFCGNQRVCEAVHEHEGPSQLEKPRAGLDVSHGHNDPIGTSGRKRGRDMCAENSPPSKSVCTTEDANNVAASLCNWLVKGRMMARSSGYAKAVVHDEAETQRVQGVSAHMTVGTTTDTCAGATSKRHNHGRAGVPALTLETLSKRKAF